MKAWLSALGSAAIGLSGCSQGQAPFRIVQLCLTGPGEIGPFTSFMNTIAQEQQMIFTDRSGQAEAELRAISPRDVAIPRPLLNIGADRAGEFNFGATNLGLPTEQIAIGFNGKNLAKAKSFADLVVARLSKRWLVHEVPDGRGALPLKRCP